MTLAFSRKMLWVSIALCVVAGLTMPVVGSPARAQDDGVQQALTRAVNWLRQELNKPSLILVEYTFFGTSWENSAMGCPIPGGTYDSGEVQGYNWTFLFDNQVRYEVHTTIDGSRAVLCSSANTSPDVKLNLYTTTTFSLLVPEAWIVYPNDDRTSVLFSPRQQTSCDQPGMRVSVTGRVASGVTPDQLLDDYLADAELSDAPSDRTTVGAFGRSTTAQAACSADTLRQWRVTVFVQYGSAYLVEQWSPVDVYDQWQELFLSMLSGFAPSDAVVGPSAMGAMTDNSDSAPTDATSTGNTTSVGSPLLAPLPMAQIFVGVVFLGALNDLPGRSVTVAPNWERRHLGFSPDGLYLSFVDVTNSQLRVMDAANGRSPKMVAEQVYALFPAAWRPDSTALAYVVADGEPDGGIVSLTLMAVTATGGEPDTLGTFAFDANCPQSADDPADHRFEVEAGPGGDELTLIWLDDERFVVSTTCDGGLAVFDPVSGTLDVLGEDLRGGSLSPQGAGFVAATPTGIAVIDLGSGVRANLSVGQGAHNLTWGADNETVYLARETVAESIVLDDPADETRGRALFGTWPVDIEIFDLALVSVNVNSLEETTLWVGQGRGIGQIAPAPDGSGVAFSVVTSAQLLAEMFQAGADPTSSPEAWPESALYWLPDAQRSAVLLAYAGQPVFAPVTIGVE